MSVKTQKILGINFAHEKIDVLIEYMQKSGGLLVAPAAPALVDLKSDETYKEALQSADLTIVDSGFLVLCWFAVTMKWIPRVSGLIFIEKLLKESTLCQFGNSFWVMPNKKQLVSKVDWLNENTDLVLTTADCYLAPMYPKDKVQDLDLLNIIEQKKPHYIIINLGGGVQEKLGMYLKNNLSYKPAIICTGAALAFLTGDQANIGYWRDKFFLGWLFRIFHNPKSFIPRYIKAFKLFPLVLKYKDQSP